MHIPNFNPNSIFEGLIGESCRGSLLFSFSFLAILYKQHTKWRNLNSMNRDDFKAALQSKKFGDFVAMYRPFWNTGGEMGNWDEELISLLPDSCRIFASAGAGFDWVDTKAMAKKGKFIDFSLTFL